ncbi:MAG: DUF6491 family protein [Exilibacterium sp.]
MKNFTAVALLFAFLAGPFALNAIANTNTNTTSVHQLADKYQFDNLEVVKRFSNWSIDGWSAVDQQSLIVRTSPSTAYLLVLSRRLHDLRFSEAIAISSTGNLVYAKFDTVTVKNHHFGGIGSVPVRIAKIYKLKGKEERELVRRQIRDT